MAGNCPGLRKETAVQGQGAQRAPKKMNVNGPPDRRIVIKIAMPKREFYRQQEKKHVIHREIPIRLSAVSLQQRGR